MQFNHLKKTDPEVFDAVRKETDRQNNTIELIASENFVSRAVMEAQGSVMTNKYAEGYPAKRWYNGCEFVDRAESLAKKRALMLFGGDHVNVQPHSGSGANMAVYFSVLEPGDTILSMDLSHGGHLTHGSPVNFSGRYYTVVPYGVNKETESIDYDELRKTALKVNPKMIVAGASAYPRILDFALFEEIARACGAYLMVDMAHIAGLVAAGCHPSPIPYSDFVTTTTHKTLRGPRGGMIFCKEAYAKKIDMQVFPGIQGGPLMHVIAAKAVALQEALSDEFKIYQRQIVANAKALAHALEEKGLRIVSGGTDNHMMLVDVRPTGITGKDSANLLHEAGITVNKNMIPFDPTTPFVTSGIRIGTPAVTTRGMKEDQMKLIASMIAAALTSRGDPDLLANIRKDVTELCRAFPLYDPLQ